MLKIIVSIISKIYEFFCYMVPIKKNYFAFYPLHDLTKLSGNLRAMIFYIKENHKDIEMVVITKNDDVKKEAKRLGIKSATPFFGFSWTLTKAECLFVDSNWFPKLLNPKMSVIQLWHGTGFKNIALLDDNVSENEKKIFEYYYRKYDLLISSSETDVQNKKDSFHAPNIVITGTPRNDVFFSTPEYKSEIKHKYALNKYDKIITYAPTFRDFETSEPFSNQFWKSLQLFLESNNQVFVVKKHPMDKYLKVPSNFPNIKDLSEKIADTQELLVVTDLLISDYSSISTDFSLSGNPILSYLYDFDTYKTNCRSMYYELDEILPKPFIFTENELLEKIMNNKWTECSDYINSYSKFTKLFHNYTDGNSCKRVMDEIMKLR